MVQNEDSGPFKTCETLYLKSMLAYAGMRWILRSALRVFLLHREAGEVAGETALAGSKVGGGAARPRRQEISTFYRQA